MKQKALWAIFAMWIGIAACTAPDQAAGPATVIRSIYPQGGTCAVAARTTQIPALFDTNLVRKYDMDTGKATVLLFDPIPVQELTVSILNGRYDAGTKQPSTVPQHLRLRLNDSLPWDITLRASVEIQNFSFKLPPNTKLSSLQWIAGPGHVPAGSDFNPAIVSIGEMRFYALTTDTIRNATFLPENFRPTMDPPGASREVEMETYSDDREETVHRSTAALEALRPVRLIQYSPDKLFALLESTGITRAQVRAWAGLIRKREEILASNRCMTIAPIDLYGADSKMILAPEIAECGSWETSKAVFARLRADMRGISEGARQDTLPGKVMLDPEGVPTLHLTRVYEWTYYVPQAFHSSSTHDKLLSWDANGMLQYEIDLTTAEEYYAERKPQLEPVERLQVREYFHSGTELDSVQTISISYSYMRENDSHYLERDFRTDW